MLVANIINLGADLGAMGAALGLLIGGPVQLYAVVFAVVCVLLETFMSYARYAAAATKAIADHGGKPLARGGRSEALEGKARARNVVLEFESYDAARRYFHSEQYQAARALREGAAEIEMVLVEGV